MAGLLWYRSYMDSLANTSGYYPDIHAGHADHVAELTIDAPYLVRDTPARYNQLELMKLVGGSVAWNQLASVADATGTVGGVPYTISGGKVSLNGTATASNNLNLMNAALPITANHVYYLCASGQTMPLSPNGIAFLQISSTNNLITISENSPRNFIVARASATEMATLRNRVQINTSYNTEYYPQIVDLTQMFDTTIADYVYSLEQATAGSGIAWLKKYDLIDDQYHAYSAPTLQSVEATAHVTMGKNLAPYPSTENGWENGYISGSGTITPQSETQLEMTSDYIPLWDATSVTLSYTLSSMPSNTNWCGFGFYADKSVGSFVSREVNPFQAATSVSSSKAVPSGAKYFRVTLRTYGNVDTLQAEYGSTATTYEPYVKHTYPLDSDLVLRGIPKLNNGNLYYDGDTYEWDGTVTRYFDIRAYQAGDESLTDAITDGTDTVYKLQTPTTESADLYTAVQDVEEGGTEEFVTGNSVPVGNVSIYRRV